MSISVVIPAYNSRRFIAETLESVLRQTLPVDEVLVIDDGSTDDTAAIAESFGPPVRVFRRANGGPSASRNFGVSVATGDWIAFVDADDLWERDKIERQMAELARHPEADICYSARMELLQDGETAKLGKIMPVRPADEIREALFINTSFLPSSVVIRRAAFLGANGFDTRFRVVEDWELWLRLLHSGTKFASCLEPLVRYRIYPASASHSAMNVLDAQEEIYRRHVQPYLPRYTRSLRYQMVRSGQESSAAYKLRTVGDARSLSMMARSILRWPFSDPHRYKVIAHMIYTRAKQGLKGTEPAHKA